MPMFENGCSNKACTEYGKREEHYFPHSDSPLPVCVACGNPKPRYISQINVIWTKPMGQYGDKTKENYQRDFEGHWMMRKNPEYLRDPKKHEQVFIDSVQKQREFCREEGLMRPDDNGPVEIHADGIGTSSNGLPGQWV